MSETLLRALLGLGVGVLGGDLAALRAAPRVRQSRPQATGLTTRRSWKVDGGHVGDLREFQRWSLARRVWVLPAEC